MTAEEPLESDFYVFLIDDIWNFFDVFLLHELSVTLDLYLSLQKSMNQCLFFVLVSTRLLLSNVSFIFKCSFPVFNSPI